MPCRRGGDILVLLDGGLVGRTLGAAGAAVAARPARAGLFQGVVGIVLFAQRMGSLQRLRPDLRRLRLRCLDVLRCPDLLRFPLLLFRRPPFGLTGCGFRGRGRLTEVGEGFGEPVQRQGRLRLLLLRVLHERQGNLLPAKGEDGGRPGGVAVVLLRFRRLDLRSLPGRGYLIVVQVGGVC